MNLADCYLLLGLTPTASLTEVKASYRRMALQYHPDQNPDDLTAKDKFIQLTQAYEFLLDLVSENMVISPKSVANSYTTDRATAVIEVTPPPPTTATPAELSLAEERLKWNSYQQLQQLLKIRKFAQATTIAEGLAQRFPGDLEVRQWLAIAYQQWGRQLFRDRQFNKAKIYFRKALKTDPHNRALSVQIEQELEYIQQNIG
ncbi:J domain-containing protein [Merismopedia glauca]|uniref:Molecular chaperone DnaJ n=1 Tax=Merismopedia glauca CCAP 1448/3 TaxID=1296344 RepID=A0A2T1BZY8_9CYAN|nr:J domain-containing protein [Merismopedia glauca]PSB01590.1 molecular chaperone DnaJ [Merismopedia glauca CCAP 1448/3]